MDEGSVREEILDKIPIPISVQTPDRKLIYENQAMRELFGDHERTFCYERYKYLDQKQACEDCPANATIIDGKVHGITRRMKDMCGKQIYLKIEHIPIVDENGKMVRFIEYMTDITEDTRSCIKLGIIDDRLYDRIHLSVIRVGQMGSEMVTSHKLSFLNNMSEKHFLIMFGAFWIAALGQGENMNEGLFGPLPVLDYHRYISYAYSTTMDSNNADYRFKGKEFTVLIIFTDFVTEPLFMNRKKIKNIIAKELETIDLVENINTVHIDAIRKNLIDHLEGQEIPRDFIDLLNLPQRVIRLK